MSEIDDKLGAILSNPQMMQQIMSLAQTLNTQSESTPAQQAQEPSDGLTQGFSPSMLAKISSLMQHGTLDKDQQSLLKALGPYLSRQKLQKLERAMQAAKVAGVASELVGTRFHSSGFRR